MNNDILKERFAVKAVEIKEQYNALKNDHSEFVVGEYNVGQIIGGMRGMTGLLYETSILDAEEGIRFRGYSIPQLRDLLPKWGGGSEPLPEGIFYLMLFNEIPTENDVKLVTEQWTLRADVPQHVLDTLDSLPAGTHPMTQFTIGVMALQNYSKFAAAYRDGVNKNSYWEFMYEDVMDLIAKLPRIAAYIYRRTYKNSEHIAPNDNLDWAGNFAHMLGFSSDEFCDLMRLYQTIHVDHEGGNVSAHTTKLVGSALSDAYLSFAAALNGLAGPLHGLANQEVIRWILDMKEEMGDKFTDRDAIADYIHKTLQEGRVVPGYGHAVLRQTDPRFIAQREFAQRHNINDQVIQAVNAIFEIAPAILSETGKIKNPWPNVDAHSGALLVYYGLIEYDFYTVLFGVSRSLGVLASLILDRYLGLPLERPKSVTIDSLLAEINSKARVTN
ncbi:MAG: citrate (Si)-synthase, eukaryotic [Bacteroidota bacterium]|nr:citrate (Si)-synthase, eukaryotic [Bacteroidota bacterium]